MSQSSGGLKFHEARPKSLIQLKWWNRLAYISRVLPGTLREMIRGMDLPVDAKLLDYGCADMPYRSAVRPDIQYLGADIQGNANAGITLEEDGGVPIDDEAVHAVLSTQVLEHVADPALYLAECFRVMRPGGKLLLSTHGLMIYHRDPVDYWRWTAEGLERQLEVAGFQVENISGVMGLAATGLQLFQDATFLGVPRLLRPGYLLIMQLAIALADRLTSDTSRQINALVFVAVAQKPGLGK